jgi:hypothetical protein
LNDSSPGYPHLSEEVITTMSEKHVMKKLHPVWFEAMPGASPLIEMSNQEAFDEAHVLHLHGDDKAAYESAKESLEDTGVTLPTKIQPSLIVAQCGTDRQERYTHVSLAAVC